MGVLSQTVTVYRADGTRRVIKNCQLERKKKICTDEQGTGCRDQFRLYVRGDCGLCPGDRLVEGIGPETVDWQTFLPETAEGVCCVAYVQPYFMGGSVTHVEAGGSYDRY